jgi:peptide/nickel transport system substrate-binding protein
VKQVAGSPLRVAYRLSPTARWSDGVAVSTADLLLAWAAGSGALNTRGFDRRSYLSPTGALTKPLPPGIVWFDERSTGLQYATGFPTLGDDHRSLTLDYSSYFADWKSALEVGLPAHVVAERAFGLSSPKAADAALISAITTRNTAQLARIARVWNTGFDVSRGTIAPSLRVSDGPYTVTDVGADGSATLSANPSYRGSHRPRVAVVKTKVITSGARQVAALREGAVDVITPAATSAAVKALINLPKITIATGIDASFEHLDLQFSHSRNGTFDSPTLRRAFLLAVPKSQIVRKVAGAIQEETYSRASFTLFPGTDAYQAAVADNGSSAFAQVDIPQARALLKKEGAKAPKVCVLFDSGNPVRTAEFILLKASEKLAGFRVVNCSSANWVAELGKPGAYDASLFGWRATSSSVSWAIPRLHSGSLGQNYNFYSSTVTDALLDTLAMTGPGGKQTQLLAQIDNRLYADGYGLPLFQLPSLTAFRTTVSGITRSPFVPGVFWNVWMWRPSP